MFTLLTLFIPGVLAAGWSRHEVALENLVLRHQRQVALRTNPSPRPRSEDRILWVWLSRLWPGWRLWGAKVNLQGLVGLLALLQPTAPNILGNTCWRCCGPRMASASGYRVRYVARLAERRTHGEVMGGISGESIQLVDDDDVDVALLEDPRQHGLELRPITRALGGGVAIHVLVHQRPSLLAEVLKMRTAAPDGGG